MKILSTAALFVTTLFCSIATAAVTVEQGQLEGTNENAMTVYRGIPFAAPPAGDLRWRAPQTAAKWSGVRAADKFGPQVHAGRRGQRKGQAGSGIQRGLPIPERLDAGKGRQ